MKNDFTFTFNFEEYLQKLVKLIPAEVIVLYSTIMALLPSNIALQISVIAICAIVTPLYLMFTLKVKNIPQIVITTISFLVYGFASGGAIETISGYQTWMPGVALALFTMITPMFVKSSDVPVDTASESSTKASSTKASSTKASSTKVSSTKVSSNKSWRQI